MQLPLLVLLVVLIGVIDAYPSEILPPPSNPSSRSSASPDPLPSHQRLKRSFHFMKDVSFVEDPFDLPENTPEWFQEQFQNIKDTTSKISAAIKKIVEQQSPTTEKPEEETEAPKIPKRKVYTSEEIRVKFENWDKDFADDGVYVTKKKSPAKPIKKTVVENRLNEGSRSKEGSTGPIFSWFYQFGALSKHNPHPKRHPLAIILANQALHKKERALKKKRNIAKKLRYFEGVKSSESENTRRVLIRQ